MHDSQIIMTHFKDLIKKYPPPNLIELLTFVQDNPEFKKNKMRFLETVEGDKRINYHGPANENVTWNFLRIQKHFTNVAKICEELESTFNIVVFCTSYYTPKNSKALPCHFDPYELLVYQVDGTKHWETWPQLPESIYDKDLNPPQEALIKDWTTQYSPEYVMLNPGETLYVEARKPHSVTTSDSDSLSHTFAFTDSKSKFVGY